MPAMFEFDTPDFRDEFSLYKHIVDRHSVLRERYQKFVCKKCGQLFELKALEDGIDPSIVVPTTQRDFFHTSDSKLVVSRRCKDALTSIPGLECYWFSIPSSPEYWVAWPKIEIHPPPDTRIEPRPLLARLDGEIFRAYGGPCKKCGRYRGVTWRSQCFRPAEPYPWAGVILQRAGGCGVAWIANEDSVSRLEASELNGFSFRPLGTDIE